MYLHIFQVGDIVMQPAYIFSKRLILSVRHLILEVGLLDLCADQLLQPAQIFRLRRAEMHVFVHDFFQLLQLIINTGIRLRRRQMLYQAGRAATLRLNTLACNNHVIRINVRQIAQGQIRIAGAVQSGVLARQPFQAAMRADMRHSISLPDIAHPAIEG